MGRTILNQLTFPDSLQQQSHVDHITAVQPESYQSKNDIG